MTNQTNEISGLRVLLVDDDDSLRQPLAKHLRRKHGYQVDTAANAEEALSRVEEAQGRYDVALIDDLLMPGPQLEPEPMGIKLMTHVKARYPSIEFILFTGWGLDSGLEALRAGAFRYLAKPLNVQELGVMIEHAAEYRRLKHTAREKRILEQLMETSAALLSKGDLQEVLDAILGGVHAIGFDRVRLYLLSDDRQSMDGIAQVGMDTGFEDLTIPIERDIYMQAVIDDPRPQVFERGDPPVPYEQELTKEAVDQWACVPLLLKGEVIGKLSVDNKFSGRPIVEAEMGPVALFASQAAAAIDNAKLVSGLNKTREELDALIASSLDAVIAINQDREITVFNRRAEEMLGWTREEILGQTVARLYEDIETAKDIFDAVNSGDAVTGQNVDLRHRDGTRIPTLLSAAVIRDSEGVPIGQAGFLRDLREVRLREQLLTALDEASRHIRAEREPSKLLYEVVRLGAWLVGCGSGGLFINLPQLRELELQVVHELPSDLRGCRVSHDEGLVGLIARTGKSRVVRDYSEWPDRERCFASCEFGTAIGIPVGRAGTVDAVLLVAGSSDPHGPTETDVEILERFAAQAALALRTSRLMTQEARMVGQLTILHEISDYIQAAQELDKILHVVLTGVTAGYGLGFNRAALLLLDDDGDCLVGRMGIGHMEEKRARQDWTEHLASGSEDFRRYLERLERDDLPLTPIGERVQGLRLPEASGADLLHQVVREQRCSIVTKEDLSRLPEDFVSAFQPAVPFVVAPLTVGGRSMGLLVADNKFTLSPITPADQEALMTLANTAAIAIAKAELMARDRDRVERLEMLSQASNEMMSDLRSIPLDRRLDLILGHAVQMLGAEAGSIWFEDEPGVRRLAATCGYVDERQASTGCAIRSGDRKGLIDYVAETGELFRAYGGELLRHPAMGGEEPACETCGKCHSVLITPLKRRTSDGDALVGVLHVENKKGNGGWPGSHLGFTEQDQSIVKIFAETAVVCLENAQLYGRTSEKLREKLDSLQAVQRTGAAITAELDLRELLERIVEATRDITNCDAVTLYAYDQDRDEFEYPPTTLGLRDKEGVTQLDYVDRDSVVWKVLKRDAPHIAEDATNDALMRGQTQGGTAAFVGREGVESSIGLPLKAGDRKVGVMFVNYRSHHRFPADEVTSIRLLADQAAIAIRNAQLYDETIGRARALEALYEAGKTVTGSLSLDHILDQMAQQAWALAGRDDRSMERAFSYIALKEGTSLRFAAACPQEHLAGLRAELGDNDLDGKGPIGITGRAARTGRSQSVGDVAGDPDYIPHNPRTHSQLAVPLRIGEEVIGVISVEHPAPDAFNEEDLQNLESLAPQAALAVRNARLYSELKKRYEQLQEIKGFVGSHTALDWMRMVSTQWGHTVNREVGTCRVCVELVRQAIGNGQLDEALAELDDLEELVEAIGKVPITAPLTAEDAVSSARINRVVDSLLQGLWRHERYASIELDPQLEPQLDRTATARASEAWLRRALEIVVDNAVESMRDGGRDHNCLTVETRRVDDVIEIRITDTGTGIPAGIRERLFSEPIEKPKGSRGAGVGLLQAKTILETYRGAIHVEETGPAGTVIVLVLPVESGEA